MSKKRLTNLIILDASGSMGTKVDEVKGGIDELVKSIKKDMKENPDSKITTIICDFSSSNDFRVLLNSSKKSDLKSSVSDKYHTRGMTALLDAIGKGFNLIPNKQDGVFINIMTDGQENDSKEFKNSDVKEMIKAARAKDWAITFMGTTESALDNARSLGISEGNLEKFLNSSAGVKMSNKTRGLTKTMYASKVLKGVSLDVTNMVANSKDEEEA